MSQFNKSLMVPVERAVRPVSASVDTKMRMREELYLHLEQAFQEERQQTKDEDQALEAAVRRLGPNHELSEELQRSVSRLDRWTYLCNRFYDKGKAETSMRHALRIGIVTVVTELLSLFLLLSLGSWLVPQKAIFSIAPMLAVLGILFGWNSFWATLLADWYFDKFHSQDRSFLSVFRRGILFAVSLGLSLVLLWLAVPPIDNLSRFFVAPGILAFFAGLVLFVLVVRLIEIEKHRLQPWESLELEQ